MTLSEAKKLITAPEINNGERQHWADLGCGAGLFSRALLALLPEGSKVYAVDKHPQDFAEPGIQFILANFETDPLQFPLQNTRSIDGILMANSLHYIKNKQALLQKLKAHLKPKGMLILVEYEKRRPNPWVPYPLNFSAAEALFREAGFTKLEKIAERPSSYSDANIYSAFCRFSPT